MEHEEIVRYLEERHISVFTVTFTLHCLLSHLQVFSRKGGIAEPEVKMCTSLNFDGKKALKECALWLLTLSQDCNDSHYKEISVGTEKHYVYNTNGNEAESVSTWYWNVATRPEEPRSALFRTLSAERAVQQPKTFTHA